MLSYYVAGNPEKPLVVLVHGVCDASTTWVDTINHLKSDYLVIALDSLGHGTSPRYQPAELPEPAVAGERELEETLEFLEETYGKTVAVVAHSMGAAMVSELSTRRPDLFRGLILEDPAWLSDTQKQGYLDRRHDQVELSQMWRGDPLQTLVGNLELRPHWNAASHFGWAFAKALVDPALLEVGIVSFTRPWQEVAAELSVPTTVITSDTDEVLVGLDGAKTIREVGNPALKVEIIPGQDHALRLGAPQAFFAILDRDLATFPAFA